MHWFKFPPVLFLDMQHHHYHLAAKLSAGVLHVETCELKNHDDDVCWLGKDWRVGYRWRHNTRHMTSFFEKKNARKRCCWNCNIWPNWFTSHQSHCCLYYKGIPEFVGKRSMLTEILLKQHKIVQISLSESRIYKKWQTSAFIQEISDSNLETGRNGSKSGVSRIVRENWQPWNTYK